MRQLSFPNGATTDEIYAKAKELGLDLCPAEVGPHLRLQYSGDALIIIAMKQITRRGGNSGVFCLHRLAGHLWLDGINARPAYRWDPDTVFVFCSRPPSYEASADTSTSAKATASKLEGQSNET